MVSELTSAMFDLTAAGMQGGLIAFGTIFFAFQFARRLFIYTSFVVLHFTFLADQINIGVLSSRHIEIV